VKILVTEQVEVDTGSGWQRFMRKHWAVFAVFIVAAVLASVGAVYVFVWFTGNSQSTGLVPSILHLWTMNNLLFFILYAVFWELVLIGIPAAVGVAVGWQWWRRIPEEEKRQYHLSGGKRSRSSSAGGAFSLFLFIAFALKVYVDGNWNAAFSTYTLDYVVGSMVTILTWIVAIIAIPAVVGLIWWIRRETSKKP